MVTRFGGLDVLVNNAAISVEQGRTVGDRDADTAALDRMRAVNHLGVIAVIRAGGSVTVSSGLGSRVGVPGLADYAATKAGVARDLGRRDITANVVEAGLMEGLAPETLASLLGSLSLRRPGRPEEIAAAVAFLASPAASYVTGAVLDTHGGCNA